MDTLFHEVVEQQLVRAHGVYRYFPAQAEGNTILIYDPHEQSRVLERFPFPRQPGGRYLCLADFVRPVASGDMDSVAFFVVTCGLGVRALATAYKDAGELREDLRRGTPPGLGDEEPRVAAYESQQEHARC